MSASDDFLRVQAEGECADSAVSSHGGSAVHTHTRGIRSMQRVSRTTPFATRFIWQGAKVKIFTNNWQIINKIWLRLSQISGHHTTGSSRHLENLLCNLLSS